MLSNPRVNTSETMRKEKEKMEEATRKKNLLHQVYPVIPLGSHLLWLVLPVIYYGYDPGKLQVQLIDTMP